MLFLRQVVLTGAVKALGLFVVPLFAMYLGPESFGIVDSFLAVAGLLALGLNQERFQTSLAAIKKGEDDWSKVSVFFLCYIVGLAIALIITQTMFGEWLSFSFLVFALFVLSLSLLTLEFLRWSDKPNLYFYFVLIDSIVLLSVPLLFIAIDRPAIPSTYLYVLLSCRLLAPAILLALSKGELTRFLTFLVPRSVDLTRIGQYLMIVFPATSYVILQNSLGIIDRLYLLVTKSDDLELLGNISLSYRLTWGTASIILVAIQAVVQPRLTHLILNNREVTSLFFRQIGPAIFVVFTVAALVVVLRQDWITSLIRSYVPEYQFALVYVPWHLGGVVLINALSYFPELIAEKRFTEIAICGTVSVLLTIIYMLLGGALQYAVFLLSVIYFFSLVFKTSGLRKTHLTLLITLLALPILDHAIFRA